MASNNDNMVNVEGGEDNINPKKRPLSAVANDGDETTRSGGVTNSLQHGSGNSLRTKRIRNDNQYTSSNNTTTGDDWTDRGRQPIRGIYLGISNKVNMTNEPSIAGIGQQQRNEGGQEGQYNYNNDSRDNYDSRGDGNRNNNNNNNNNTR